MPLDQFLIFDLPNHNKHYLYWDGKDSSFYLTNYF